MAPIQAFIVFDIVEGFLKQERQYGDEDGYKCDGWHVGDLAVLLALVMAHILINK